MVKIYKINFKKLSVILLSSLTIITISGCTSNTKPYYENKRYSHSSLIQKNKVKVINRKSRYYKI